MESLRELTRPGSDARRLAWLNVAVAAVSGLVLGAFFGLLAWNSAGAERDLPVGYLLPLILVGLASGCIAVWLRFGRTLTHDPVTRRRTAVGGALPIFLLAGLGVALSLLAALLPDMTAAAVLLGLLLSAAAASAGVICVAVVARRRH